MKMKLKKFLKIAKIYMSLPHILVLIAVSVLALIMFILSVVYKGKNPFVSSLFANIFAGLLTGVIICLIATIKSVSLYRTEWLIEWLDGLHNDCLNFYKMHRKILFARENCFKDDEEFNDFIYDVLCCGNDISQKINQSQYDKSLPLNTYSYCKKVLHFDVDKVIELNNLLRDDIIESWFSLSSKAEAIEIFKPMKEQIDILDRKILSEYRELIVKKKALKVSIG